MELIKLILWLSILGLTSLLVIFDLAYEHGIIHIRNNLQIQVNWFVRFVLLFTTYLIRITFVFALFYTIYLGIGYFIS